MSNLKRSHRCAGLIVGAAVGDALGAPFEFQSANNYKLRFPSPVYGGIGEMIGGGSFNWSPAEFTDDTQMALALALSIIENDGFDPDHVWTYWRSWAKTANDIGNTSGVTMSVVFASSNAILRATIASGTWTIKTITRGI